MTTMVSELYTALKAAGVDDEIARAAARSVIAIEDKEQLATKADLALQTAALTKTILTALVAMTAIFSAISALLRLVK
jgi:hypothetical protein